MRKVLNIAHRGFTRDFPDNTLEAFRAALELGVDGIEFDVQETADGEFVIFHDDEIEGKAFSQLSLVQVQHIPVKGGFKIPGLEETLRLCNREVILIIELKQVRSLSKFLQVLNNCVDGGKVVIVSFSRELVAEVGRLAPHIMGAVISEKPAGIEPRSSMSVIGVRCSHVNQDLISRAHADNTMVFVWGCDNEVGVRDVLQFEIDGIISDLPDMVKRLLADKAIL